MVESSSFASFVAGRFSVDEVSALRFLFELTKVWVCDGARGGGGLEGPGVLEGRDGKGFDKEGEAVTCFLGEGEGSSTFCRC